MTVKTITNEPRRGCGFRKEGGLYLVSGGLAAECGRLPVRLDVCPVCNSGIKPTRSWQWISPAALFKIDDRVVSCRVETCRSCPVSHPPERAGLLWVGEAFYKTPGEFTAEATAQGVSRRISGVPKDFMVGWTWVFLAHRKAFQTYCPECNKEPPEDRSSLVGAVPKAEEDCETCAGTGWIKVAGIFHAFLPTAVQYIVKPDDEQEKLEALEKRGITLVKLVRTDDGNGNGVLDLEDDAE